MSNIVYIKAKEFAISAVRTCQVLTRDHEYILSKQLLRSGTSIGANIAESTYAQSRADFISKRSVALKEASETLYWLELLHDTGYLSDSDFNGLSHGCTELIKLLTASINTTKNT